MMMQFRTCILIAMLLLVPLGVSADGVYIPKAVLNSATHAADITEPTQKAVLVHFGGQERLILQVSYKGNVKEFAWLVPTPSRPTLSKVGWPIFHQLHQATAPVYRYWLNADELLATGGGMMFAKARGGRVARPAVEVLEQRKIGFYDIAVLRASDSGALVGWLQDNCYAVTTRLTGVLDDYIRRGWVFTAARINTGAEEEAKEPLSQGVLQSIQLEFPSRQPIYPLKISSLNKGNTEVLIYTVSDHRLTAPGLDTVCVLPATDWGLRVNVWREAFVALDTMDFRPNKTFVTKLTGTFAPSEMTSDLVLSPTPSDTLVDRPVVSPPFLENLGAASLLVMMLPFTMPLNALTFVACVVMLVTPWGRRQSTVWTTGALGAVLLPIPLMLLTGLVHEEGHYWPFGVAAICGFMLATVVIVVGRRRARRNTASA